MFYKMGWGELSAFNVENFLESNMENVSLIFLLVVTGTQNTLLASLHPLPLFSESVSLSGLAVYILHVHVVSMTLSLLLNLFVFSHVLFLNWFHIGLFILSVVSF